MALTDQVLIPGSDYQAICDATRALTGTTATLKSGEVADAITSAKSETWLFNIPITPPSQASEITYNIKFRSASLNFTKIRINPDTMTYISDGGEISACAGELSDWVVGQYRKITIDGNYDSDFKAWLETNATRLDSEFVLQQEKTVRVGGVNQRVIPDGYYDGMRNVTIGSFINNTIYRDLAMLNGNQAVSSSSGYMTDVIIRKPSTLIPENIKSGVNIGGVVGTMEAGASGFDVVTGTFFNENEESEAVIQLPDGYSADLAAFLIVQNMTGSTESNIVQEIYAFNPRMSINNASAIGSVKNALMFSFSTTGSPRMTTCSVQFEGSSIDISISTALTYFSAGGIYKYWLYIVPAL